MKTLSKYLLLLVLLISGSTLPASIIADPISTAFEEQMNNFPRKKSMSTTTSRCTSPVRIFGSGRIWWIMRLCCPIRHRGMSMRSWFRLPIRLWFAQR